MCMKKYRQINSQILSYTCKGDQLVTYRDFCKADQFVTYRDTTHLLCVMHNNPM